MTKNASVGGEATRATGLPDNLSGRQTDGRPPELQPGSKVPEATDVRTSDEDLDAQLDAEQVEREKAMRRLGFTDEEITRQRGTAGEPQKPPTRATIEQQLAELKALKASDPKAYWADATQATELRLIEQLQKLKAGNSPAPEAEETDDDGTAELSPAEKRLAEIRTELAEVRSKARNARGQERDAAESKELELIEQEQVAEAGLYVGEDVAPALVATWAEQGGVAHHVGVLAGMVKSISGALDDAGRDAFVADLEALPAAVRKLTYEQFSVAGGSLKARLDAIEKGLAGADLAAAQAFRAKHGEALRRGLVG